MRKIIEEKILYRYSELSPEAQTRAMDDLINCWIDTIPVDSVSHNSNYYKAYRESQRMQTPWFFGNYIFKFCKKQLEQELKTLEFLSNGVVYIARA